MERNRVKEKQGEKEKKKRIKEGEKGNNEAKYIKKKQRESYK